MRMLDGFREGWITFQQAPERIVKGSTPLEAILNEGAGTPASATL